MGFAYHANAAAFGAVIEKPSCDIIPTQASAVLCPSGGEASAIVRNFDYKGIISFDEAKSYVAGSFEGDHDRRNGAYNTLATTTIRNLNIANMLHVELLVARVSTKHDVENGKIDEEGQITFDGSLMEGLRIAGFKGDVTLDASLFSDFPTYRRFMAEFPADRRFKAKKDLFWSDPTSKEILSRGMRSGSTGAGDPGLGLRPAPPPSDAFVPECADGIVNCSLFDSLSHRIEPKDPNSEKQHVYLDGYGVVVKEFGRVNIAQVTMKRGQRSLTMVGLELGCPLCGTGSGGSVEGNGSPTVP
jgi:hypothetical protein